jgi:hypothetical protein
VLIIPGQNAGNGIRSDALLSQLTESVARATSCYYPLPIDHRLLRLIESNVGRGLTQNKCILRSRGTFMPASVNDTSQAAQHSYFLSPCEMVVGRPTPTGGDVPTSLIPTKVQMTHAHPSWMDALPFPLLRDNLIRAQGQFNPVTFLEDLVGDLAHSTPFTVAPKVGWKCQQQKLPRMDRGDDEVPPSGRGLILWGDAHVKENWEVTPLFLQRWAWATRGTEDELVAIANSWRAARCDDDIESEMQALSI